MCLAITRNRQTMTRSSRRWLTATAEQRLSGSSGGDPGGDSPWHGRGGGGGRPGSSRTTPGGHYSVQRGRRSGRSPGAWRGGWWCWLADCVVSSVLCSALLGARPRLVRAGRQGSVAGAPRLTGGESALGWLLGWPGVVTLKSYQAGSFLLAPAAAGLRGTCDERNCSLITNKHRENTM